MRRMTNKFHCSIGDKGDMKMTPESLDEYLVSFGDNVSMRSKSGGKMVPVVKLREYVKAAIKTAEDRIKNPKKETKL